MLKRSTPEGSKYPNSVQVRPAAVVNCIYICINIYIYMYIFCSGIQVDHLLSGSWTCMYIHLYMPRHIETQANLGRLKVHGM